MAQATAVKVPTVVRVLARWNMDRRGGHLVTPHRYMRYRGISWSPDGQWIAFDRPGSGHVYIVHPSGAGLRQVPLPAAVSDARMFAAGWSPDATRLVFSMYTPASDQVDLYTANLDGSDLVRITDTPHVDERGAAWEPPG